MMTQEDKELLLKDLCARLPYSVKCYPVITNGEPNTIGGYCEVLDDFYIREVGGWFPISIIKPYLRPMSSMTEEERKQLEHIFNDEDWPCWVDEDGCVNFARSNDFICPEVFEIYFDFLNAHHIDYRGLIEKGLALEAPEGMYNLNEK